MRQKSVHFKSVYCMDNTWKFLASFLSCFSLNILESLSNLSHSSFNQAECLTCMFQALYSTTRAEIFTCFFAKNFYWSNYALQICSRNSHLLSTYVKLIFSEFETNIQFEQWVNPYSTLLVFALVNCCKSLKNLNRRIEWHLSSSKRSISK